MAEQSWGASAGEEASTVEQVIAAPTRDLGDGFQVRRALPSARRRMVGPFVFLDQMGPALLTRGHGLDVRPHPHIGLSTATYLFDGELVHRDSLGAVQRLGPGGLNWMTAGKGVVHSERTPPEVRERDASRVFGIQAWVALPRALEESEPWFAHHAGEALPEVEGEGVWAKVIAGSMFGVRAPTRTLSDMFYADVLLQAGARVAVPTEHVERAGYVAVGAVAIESERLAFEQGSLVVFKPGAELTLTAAGEGPARVMLLGGEPLDGPRHIFWNLVSSSRELIEKAKADWRGGRFPKVPGETEFIPLPDDRPPPAVRYP